MKDKNGQEKVKNEGTAVPGTVLKLIEKVLKARKVCLLTSVMMLDSVIVEPSAR